MPCSSASVQSLFTFSHSFLSIYYSFPRSMALNTSFRVVKFVGSFRYHRILATRYALSSTARRVLQMNLHLDFVSLSNFFMPLAADEQAGPNGPST